jgi:hypothetical protein
MVPRPPSHTQQAPPTSFEQRLIADMSARNSSPNGNPSQWNHMIQDLVTKSELQEYATKAHVKSELQEYATKEEVNAYSYLLKTVPEGRNFTFSSIL